ncbi:MAG: hypothetical protein HGB05_22875 [Chloroflexi bacterium]|nr:hypothetical protein [Chloroflexota bacterium]
MGLVILKIARCPRVPSFQNGASKINRSGLTRAAVWIPAGIEALPGPTAGERRFGLWCRRADTVLVS